MSKKNDPFVYISLEQDQTKKANGTSNSATEKEANICIDHSPFRQTSRNATQCDERTINNDAIS